ncbi:hypothetical protein DY000_02030338 [Brassica cretica]|uniref:Uncharacterized protein n=1 Tax=Brassica cretica TaxID=69181 RepID=A0ABQ7DG79_BRACR|nr:hypothetical protein DY000_02030338 [Brassica cretica]
MGRAYLINKFRTLEGFHEQEGVQRKADLRLDLTESDAEKTKSSKKRECESSSLFAERTLSSVGFMWVIEQNLCPGLKHSSCLSLFIKYNMLRTATSSEKDCYVRTAGSDPMLLATADSELLASRRFINLSRQAKHKNQNVYDVSASTCEP